MYLGHWVAKFNIDTSSLATQFDIIFLLHDTVSDVTLCDDVK